MSDRVAFALALFLAALIAVDVVANGSTTSLFLLRKFADLVEFVSFWR